jgi:glycerol-3-phosphate dehydrogenase
MTYDLAVIGAGYTGLGVALAAVEQGLSVVVIEQSEFGSGASANSHRIVHGGFRYLQQLNIKRVRESALAQAEVYRRYGNFVDLLPCYTPLSAWGLKSRWPVLAALFLFRCICFGIAKPRVPIGKLVKADDVPGAWQAKCKRGALLWYDLQISNYKGLLAAIAAEIAQKGGELYSQSRVVEVLESSGAIASLKIDSEHSEIPELIQARYVANCVGAWHELSASVDSQHPFYGTAWIKAFNISLRRDLGIDSAFAFAGKLFGGALYFLTPRGNASAIGTIYGDLPVHVDGFSVSSDEVAEVLKDVAGQLPELTLSFSDVGSVEVGLLPALCNARTARYTLISKDRIAIKNNFADILAVKFTTFLRLGRRVVRELNISRAKRP